jgi:lipopolysaccharide/colanic/teichoic acid biosynthesis glycosyltransferase
MGVGGMQPVRAHGRRRAAEDVARRALDIAVAVAVLLFLLPVMALIAVAILTTSPGGVLFRQARIGLDRRPFQVLKFRTMTVGCNDEIHREFVTQMLRGDDGDDDVAKEKEVYKLAEDPRITRVGRILRRTSLDELPQLVNVLRGEMSLVGPRPPLAWEVDLYEPHHHERFLVNPGLTGLWQVSGRSTLSMLQALDLDVEYARRQGLFLDLAILARTVPVVLRGDGAR